MMMSIDRILQLHPRRFVLVFALAAASGYFLGSTSRALAAEPTTQPAPHLAVYRWGAPKGPAQVDAFGEWVGKPDVWAEDFEANDTWDNIESPGWLLWPWQNWVKTGEGRRLILSVVMLPGAWDRSGPSKGIDAHVHVSLKAGANGDYNHHFQVLATELAKRGLGNSILRIGWEMNGGWYTDRASDDPKAWAEYFRQIVTTMRAVPGAEKLVFCWNPATQWLQFPAETAWPGDEYVDVVGIDVYDQSWAKGTYPIPKDASDADRLARQMKAWDQWNYNGDHGMVFWSRFAADHHKPLAICEWGICNRTDGHGGMDDPYFVQQMYQFIMDPKNNVIFHCYFDVQAGDGHHQLSDGKGAKATEFPKSAALFKQLFGGANGQDGNDK
jgi:hypothetical protein